MTVSRLLYVDDSGSVTSGLIVYGWVECGPARWRHALRGILELRKRLYRAHSVPPSTELHATKFVNGRARISTAIDDAVEWKTLGRAVALDCLTALAEHEHLRMDGNGTDSSYTEAHRELELDTRHIIEDPTFYDSRRSQFVQMADLVAYSAFASLNRHEGNRFAWEWYAEHLASADPHGGPQEV
ncbi:DUF3800 domain-containing protein [Herbiconiux sp. VKM Ac-2851]|uniref:DUF3800 domain-containing protein n=1 Tax=Herbiconiux sp. VKM Ac-2851 TaxID=2739025 RepID=UPI001562F6A8|nr:DUF3800 domain-containing protein [Herbiconiux sp. VKM Ac-2851]NQX35943.1 DUF3800 domain-containing protein [Herbiconiux sp. VKM Ac-2851]